MARKRRRYTPPPDPCRPGESVFDALRRVLGAGDPADLRTLGLASGPTRDQVNVRFRELAKVRHPDHGGDDLAFRELHAARDRLLAVIVD